jgi:hypothetical protein
MPVRRRAAHGLNALRARSRLGRARVPCPPDAGSKHRRRAKNLQPWPPHTADMEPRNNSVSRCAHLSFAPRLTFFRWHNDGASSGMMVLGERSPPEAITWHSCIKQERPCSIHAGGGRRLRFLRFGILRVGRSRSQCQDKRDYQSRHDGFSSRSWHFSGMPWWPPNIRC